MPKSSSLWQLQGFHADEKYISVAIERRMQFFLKFVIGQTLCHWYGERTPLARKKEIFPVWRYERNLFFRKTINSVFQMTGRSPLPIAIKTDVQIPAQIRLTAGVDVFRTMVIRRSLISRGNKDQRFSI